MVENDAGEASAILEVLAEAASAGGLAAVLTRTNWQAERITSDLIERGLPVARRETVFPEDWRIAKAALRMLAVPSDDSICRWLRAAKIEKADYWIKEAALGRSDLAQVFLSGLGEETTQGALKLLFVSEASLDLIGTIDAKLPGGDLEQLALAVTAWNGEEIRGDGIYVGTIHSAKGREWETVILAGFEDHIIPGKRDENEERRIAYVGMTRAKRRLVFMRCQMRERQFERWLAPTIWSRFLSDVEGELVSR